MTRQPPIDTLRILATDTNEWIRAAVGANPATPADILRTLATDTNRQVFAGRSGWVYGPATTLVREAVGGNVSAGALPADPAGDRPQVSDLPVPEHGVARRFRPPVLELPDL